MHIKVGTRGSKLALIQTNLVTEALSKVYPSYTFEIVEIKTKGDKIQDKSLQKIGDKGLFINEIEEQLLNKTIDMAVHSSKDLPSDLPDKLTLCKTILREDAHDVLVLRKDCDDPKIIGTGSLRRQAQMPKDFIAKDIRGNIDTRLRKLDSGEYDGIIVAAAGLKRMQLENRISKVFEIDEIIPACTQGAIAIECRKEDTELLEQINQLSNTDISTCVEAERLFLKEIDGDCHIPMGAHCLKIENTYEFYACFGQTIQTFKKICIKGKDPYILAKQAAKQLKE